ncbi:hypothetical protein HB852_09940 [Listeria grandensis]|uniref:hypothetical protein n=1 Tax=Listeria grandensis TaxID=1494963 RepID=UPI00162883E6|nr:hypothetical protein [Listeria grandensis]MBC1474938.1 hypothetical protein [Listeria grandensis]
MTDVEKMDERQKKLLWHMQDDYAIYRGANGFTASLYWTIESLIEFKGKFYLMYGDFNEKERVQIIQAFTNWALEQEDDE